AIALRSICPASSRIRSPKRSSSAFRTRESSRIRRWTIWSLETVAAPWRAKAARASLLPAPMPPVIATATGRATRGLLRRRRRLAVGFARALLLRSDLVGLDAGVRVLDRRLLRRGRGFLFDYFGLT